MNKFSKIIFTSAVFVFMFAAMGAAEAKAQGPLNEIFKRMQAHKEALSSLIADLRQEKTDTLLGETDVKTGTVKYLPGKGRNVFVRIDWLTPVKEHLAVANGQYVLYQPRLKQAIVGKTSEAGEGRKQSSALAFMNMSKGELRKNYITKFIGVEKVGGNEMWHLNLVPKIKTSYKMADLWVDGNGMPIQATIIENNGDTTTILLTKLQKNVSINGNDFKIDLPKGTKIIR